VFMLWQLNVRFCVYVVTTQCQILCWCCDNSMSDSMFMLWQLNVRFCVYVVTTQCQILCLCCDNSMSDSVFTSMWSMVDSLFTFDRFVCVYCLCGQCEIRHLCGEWSILSLCGQCMILNSMLIRSMSILCFWHWYKSLSFYIAHVIFYVLFCFNCDILHSCDQCQILYSYIVCSLYWQILYTCIVVNCPI
jgi:hypothetical protein